MLLVFGASPLGFLFLATVRLGGEVYGGDGGGGGGRGEGSVQRLHQGYQLVACTNLMVKSLLRPNSKIQGCLDLYAKGAFEFNLGGGSGIQYEGFVQYHHQGN